MLSQQNTRRVGYVVSYAAHMQSCSGCADRSHTRWGYAIILSSECRINRSATLKTRDCYQRHMLEKIYTDSVPKSFPKAPHTGRIKMCKEADKEKRGRNTEPRTQTLGGSRGHQLLTFAGGRLCPETFKQRTTRLSFCPSLVREAQLCRAPSREKQ